MNCDPYKDKLISIQIIIHRSPPLAVARMSASNKLIIMIASRLPPQVVWSGLLLSVANLQTDQCYAVTLVTKIISLRMRER